MTNLINQDIKVHRAQIDEIVKALHELTIKIGHDALAKTVSDLRSRLHDPFMFVIVGEVKAGKSSFINALLDAGKEVAKAAPQPMTDTIQQILFGEKEEFIDINPYLKKILLPVDILQEIAIVDTPGTNTIVEHHQEITESFIPASDLIVFVFEAKNPYRQSAWEFFDYIHAEWRKKIIFVLQQKDLMSEEDLQINIRGVKDQAEKKGIQQPNVFAVSAKQELDGEKMESGFTTVRDYINHHITGGKAPILKLQNNVSTSIGINERIEKGLQTRAAQYEADVEFREDIKGTLNKQEEKSNKQVDVLVENLIAGYDRITLRKEKELQSGLSFFSLLRRSITALFSKKASAKEWLEGLATELETELNSELKNKLNEGVVDLADSIQQMAKLIDLKIRNSQTILRNNHDVFSDIAERRSGILKDLQETFSKFISRSENFTDDELFPDKQTLSPNVATGSGIAVIGVILATVTNGMVFDITGGILTTIGLLFAGVSTSVKKKKIIKGFQNEIEKGRSQLNTEITEKLKTYIKHLKKKISGNFQEFDQMLDREKTQIEQLKEEHTQITEKLTDLKDKLS